MPSRPKHPCRHPGCPGLVPHGRSYCAAHQAEQDRVDRARRERYEQRVQRGSAAAHGYDANWRRVRDRQLQACPICQRCQARRATIVHHIDGNAFNNASTNLLSVCASCHQKIHSDMRI